MDSMAYNKKQKIVVIVGPTSSGKSALAVELARTFNGEVVSADSRQVFQGLDIGAGKIKKREMRGVPHHLLDVASPKRIFTAHDFLRRAQKVVEDIARRGKLPIVAGGTGFYIDALVGRTILPDVSPNHSLRARLETKSAEQLFALLKKKDPRRAKRIDSHNKRHLIRALEIINTLGKVPTIRNRLPYDVHWIGITLPREELYKNIHVRLLSRMREGMVAEARRLRACGLSSKRMEALGLEYRALARHLEGKVGRAEMIRELEYDIRHYAKRQMTYWRRNKTITWFLPKDTERIEKVVEEWITKRRSA